MLHTRFRQHELQGREGCIAAHRPCCLLHKCACLRCQQLLVRPCRVQGRAQLDGHKQPFCLAQVPALTSNSHVVGASMRPEAAASRRSLTWSCPMALTSSRRACRGTLHWGEAAAVTPTSMARMARFHMLHQGSSRVSGLHRLTENACSARATTLEGLHLALDPKRVTAVPKPARGQQPARVIPCLTREAARYGMLSMATWQVGSLS